MHCADGTPLHVHISTLRNMSIYLDKTLKSTEQGIQEDFHSEYS